MTDKEKIEQLDAMIAANERQREQLRLSLGQSDAQLNFLQAERKLFVEKK